jgi:DNA-directed RNA polymerase subunit RPC12/RpoP
MIVYICPTCGKDRTFYELDQETRTHRVECLPCREFRWRSFRYKPIFDFKETKRIVSDIDPYGNWSCNGCAGTIISKRREKDFSQWVPSDFLFTIDVYEIYIDKGLPSVLEKYGMRKMEVKNKNIIKVFKKICSSEDPYGEENWEE